MTTKDNNGNTGSDQSGSIGSDNGSNGSVGSIGSDHGSGGSIGSDDRSGGSDDRSGGSDDGSGGSSNAKSERSDTFSNSGIASGNKNNLDNEPRKSRNARNREQRTIKLGSLRSGNSDAEPEFGNGGTDNRETELSQEPVIRLGAKQKKQPKNNIVNDETKPNIKISESKDLISVFLSSIFEIPAIVLKQDFWRLSKDENKTLTDAIVGYLESLPKNKGSKIAVFISEHFPILNLVMIAFFIVSDRVKQTLQINQIIKQGNVIHMNKQKSQATKTDIFTPMDSIFN